MFLRYKICLGIFVVTLFSFASADADSAVKPPDEPMNKVLLEQYLVKAGIQLDCYFTLEKDRRGGKTSALDTSYVMDEPTVGSLSQLIKKLSIEAPTIVVRRSQKNPAVVHLLDKSLESDNYVLSKVTDVTYSGALAGLPNDISVQVAGRVTGKNSAWIDEMFDDWITNVSIVAEKEAIRDILTSHVPLSQYRRFLWNAVTDNEKEVTQIQYYGPTPENYLRWMKTTSITPFSKGEVAFRLNSKSDETVQQALAFINSQMKSNKPEQVRWAMLFLGKFKVETAIPVLLKNLTYQYTTSSIETENFPALQALISIGKPASKAALELLATETNAQRLELLSRVVLNVDGPKAGRTSVESVAANVEGAAQRQRINTALTAAEQNGA